MNLKQLEVFKAIMETGSTIAAAAALSLSQSAISRQLSALEEEVGIELFVRDKGRLTPRPEAHALVRDVEELAESFLRVRRKVAGLRTGAFGDTMVKVALPHSLANTMMPQLVGRFLADRRGMSVEILPGPYDAIERMVRGRVADLGFVRLPAEDVSLEARPIIESGTSCVMPAGHPLAARASVDLKDLAGCDLILLGRQRINRNELEYELRRAAPAYRCRLEVHSVETACACAAEGLGVAIVPTMIAHFFRRPELVMRPFHPARVHGYGIITLPGLALSWPAETLIAAIRDHMAGIAAQD